MALEALVSKDWDRYFLEIARMGSSRSKDPSTKVGSCIVKDKKVLSIGYNGAPRKFDDNLVPTSSDTTLPLKDQKYAYVCHSEVNAILNYGGSMRDFEGATLYVTISPCHECAKIIIQSGIKRVVYLEDYHRTETADMAKLLFRACGVEYGKIDC